MYTITQFVERLFAKQARVTGFVIILVSVIVFAASIKFSTDRFARTICDQINDNARNILETNGEDYNFDFKKKLETQYGLLKFEITETIPKPNWKLYPLGACSLQWQNNRKAALYVPTDWAGDVYFLKALIKPRFFRTDLVMFMLAISLVLLVSYLLGTRYFVRMIDRKISKGILEVWECLKTGKEPDHIEIMEIQDLWKSTMEYRTLLDLRLRMIIAKSSTHEVKSPTYYQYNQLRRLSLIDDSVEQKAIIAETLEKAGELIDSMEKALRKIATNDFAHHPKPIDLTALIKRKDRKFSYEAPVEIMGDKTLIQVLIDNLYKNAVESCGDMSKIVTEMIFGDRVELSISNPVKSEVDTSMLFVSGFSSKIDGTGLGLSLARCIVELHFGEIRAEYIADKGLFRIVVRFPSSKDEGVN